MPTLIRLVIVVVVLAALAYGAMFALVAMVEPNEKDVTIRIPARDLIETPTRDPLVLREIDTSREAGTPVVAQPDPEPEPAPDTPGATGDAAGEEGSVVTLSPGVE